MNVSFSPDATTPVLADACVSISQLKKNPAAVIAAAREQQVAILSRNKPVAYLISPEIWAYLAGLVEDQILARIAREELDRGEQPIPVTIDELLA